jgi:translation initiation factor 2 beta subunit (eIF-2beta)/eIF-5
MELEFSTAITVKAEGQYMIGGRYSEQNIKKIVGKYITKRHMCRECHCCSMSYVKEDRIVKAQCTSCTAGFVLV